MSDRVARVSRPAFDMALRELEHSVGADGPETPVTFSAQQPALTTRFRAAEAAAAALAAGAGMAERIGRRRGLETSAIEVSSRHAEASLLSFAHLRFADPKRAPEARLAPEQRTAAAGFHRTADDRWVYLHPGFPHNTRGILQLLDVPDDRDAVRDAVAALPGEPLEQALGDAGLCGALVRTPREWDASLPGRLLAGRPVVEVIQLGESAPVPWPEGGSRPLDGARVLDLTRVLAGPTCARTLASYGAEALRIGAEHLPTIPLFVADTGFGKRSAHLDLTRPDEQQRLRRLIRDADVFAQGYRTGALDRLGFGVTDVAQLNPGIVYVSINCYGHEGPWRQRPGWEQLAQTVTGMAHTQGEHTGSDAPALLPAAVNDYITGYLAAFGTLAALERRARVGGSYWVRVSLARTAMWVRGLGLRRQATARPAEAPEVATWQTSMETPWGRVHYLRPAVNMTPNPPHWTLPPAPPGTHPPAFD